MTIAREELLALPPNERRELRDLLDESLVEEGDYDLTADEWSDVERDLEGFREGTLHTVPAHEALAKLRAKYGI